VAVMVGMTMGPHRALTIRLVVGRGVMVTGRGVMVTGRGVIVTLRHVTNCTN
jgi:hypothetical protein